MGKRLFLLLFSAFIGIIASPEILMASDDFAITGLNNAGITETVPIVVEESEPEEEEVANTDSARETSYNYQNYGEDYTPEPVSWTKNYTVSINIGSVDEYTDTVYSLSYSHIYKFRKMIYGHNTANLLGSLPSLSYGEIFTITEGGVTKEYRVMDTAVYAKTADGNLEGNPKLMGKIANTAMGYDAALLTCYGTSYGNGDASHRYVVFADAI